ncbi:hypothetical protein P3T76_006349 [Phytophthora citrophthora]|uniref:Uncharacterized protein n=1 Tax=Phytophthora citrophthora TaxID=4793 RepID=A0AAD9GP25_9STRA|nr:hypothetical protein P3T76_006349 [Phytophthora citrophthora]
MQREECIYNLIPKVRVEPVKPERYRSKFDPNMQPTGTTFGVRGKTKLEGANLGSAQRMDKPASARGFGRLPAKPDPKSFIRKGERASSAIVSKKRELLERITCEIRTFIHLFALICSGQVQLSRGN